MRGNNGIIILVQQGCPHNPKFVSYESQRIAGDSMQNIGTFISTLCPVSFELCAMSIEVEIEVLLSRLVLPVSTGVVRMRIRIYSQSKVLS